MPQLPRGAIWDFLCGSDDTDSGLEWQASWVAKVILGDRGQRGQAAGGRAGIADNIDNIEVMVMILMIYAQTCGHQQKGQGWWWPLGSILSGSPSLLQVSEDISGFYNIFRTSITSFDVGASKHPILLLEGGARPSTDDKLPILSLDCGITCYGIILEHVDHVAKVSEGIIDDNIHLTRIKSILVTRHPI